MGFTRGLAKALAILSIMISIFLIAILLHLSNYDLDVLLNRMANPRILAGIFIFPFFAVFSAAALLLLVIIWQDPYFNDHVENGINKLLTKIFKFGRPQLGAEALIGQSGVVTNIVLSNDMQELNLRVKVGNEIWKAVVVGTTDIQPNVGQLVKIVEIDGLSLKVEFSDEV